MKKHTTGKCRISLEIENLIECDGVDIAVAKYSMPSKVLKLKCVQNWDEAKANASLICEAFNVANETGKTPRQLAEINEKYLKALKTIIRLVHADIYDIVNDAIHDATK